MKKQYLKATICKVSDGGIEFVASDETRDRHGEVISLDSWDITNFLRAPRLLVDHDSWNVSKIVGKWEDVRIDKASDKPGLKMRAHFHGITELSREVEKMVKGGFLDTVSVGFIPHLNDEKNELGETVEVERNELVEVSLVTVPANPNATQIKTLLEAEEMADATEKIKEFMGDVDTPADPVPEAKTDTGGESTKIVEDKPVEKRKDTQPVQEKSVKGRSLSISEKKNAVMHSALKEAVKTINFALNRINKN